MKRWSQTLSLLCNRPSTVRYATLLYVPLNNRNLRLVSSHGTYKLAPYVPTSPEANYNPKVRVLARLHMTGCSTLLRKLNDEERYREHTQITELVSGTKHFSTSTEIVGTDQVLQNPRNETYDDDHWERMPRSTLSKQLWKHSIVCNPQNSSTHTDQKWASKLSKSLLNVVVAVPARRYPSTVFLFWPSR